MTTVKRHGDEQDFSTRQAAELWALLRWGRSLSGVTFHEQEPPLFWIGLRNVRSNDEVVECPSCRRGEPCAENERIVAERDSALTRRLALALATEHEERLLAQYDGKLTHDEGARVWVSCPTCALIAEARG